MDTPIPGDLVTEAPDPTEWVVVDVTDDGAAVLRAEADLELTDPKVRPVGALTVAGHVDGVDGWTETTPGVWVMDE